MSVEIVPFRGSGSVLSQCRGCGITVKRTPSNGPALYCSRACRSADINATGECRTCGKQFTFKKVQRKFYRGAGTFCSVVCRQTFPQACDICGETFTGPTSKRRCASHPTPYVKDRDPRTYRAHILAQPLKMGRGKLTTILGMLDTALGRPCAYCQSEITLDNASLDHRNPTGAPRSAVRPVDTPENIQIICRRCNQAKGDFTDAEYRALLTLSAAHPALGWKLRRRLLASFGAYMNHKMASR